ncbi:GntR family transcriptional regulator [Leifsonia sp. PS1209]|uniref:GntR family transcriptional regulator n=1 Tax=Leifsonia sp. PS1209 TaxID=2724914 RepID=UPI001442A830|nr:GntR family transcriptional regulator [Leifsonia sp. PS1209]QIZ97155.1 GntR family transcriptional regulator [Leifsonia sp. PS1209]
MPMPTDHVARVSLSDEAYTRIEAAIMDGTLEPGERLRDPELVQWLGISRTPIRHALDRLLEQGLVEMERNRYTRVAAFDVDGVRSAIEVAGDLWAGAALRSHGFWPDDDLHLLDDIAETLVEAAGDNDTSRYVRAFEHLATMYVRVEGNPVRLRTLSNVMPQVRRIARKLNNQVNTEAVREFVGGLSTATRAGDGPAAAAQVSAYIARIGGVLGTLKS